MSERKWTAQQQDFLDSPRGPVLVSAAAGSGKTAAVVGRVIKRICEKKLDVNRLLMTTFSNASANEMKSRIQSAVTEKLSEQPENDYLASQSELVDGAQISTIHAFCLKIIRENFSSLDLFCDVRVVDESENEILRQTALDTVIGKAYAEKKPEFIRLVELVCNSRNDIRLGEIVLDLYEKVIAMPFPGDVLEAWLSNVEGSEKSYKKWAGILAESALKNAELIEKVCLKDLDELADKEKSGFIIDDLKAIREVKRLLEKCELEKAYGAVHGLRIDNKRLPKKIDGREKIKADREMADSAVKEITGILSYSDKENFIKDQQILYKPTECLFNLVREFIEQFSFVKREKNLVDFSDAEQFMLSLLWQKNKAGEYEKTQLAISLAGRYDEIYIDEYQDVNAAQEMIFRAIEPESGNVFMVGDVKQSIYGFRQADADIFEQKKNQYNSFDTGKYPSKIFFDKNFRSRSEITSFVNRVFSCIMTQNTCSMQYTENDFLKAGVSYEKKTDSGVSLLFYESEKGSREKTWKEQEATFVAAEIERIVKSGYKVSDSGGQRACRYSDFCILSRTDGERFAAFSDALSALGIDSVIDGKGSDFLENREMLIVRAILKAINNPFDDVALCAAMMSPVFLFTPTELSEIKSGKQEKSASLFAAVKMSSESGNEKSTLFIEKLRELQRLASARSVDGLLSVIYNRFGLYNMVAAMNEGDVRTDNLDMFRYYARQFEQNGYKGLGEFVRFIEKTQESDKRLSSVQSVGEGRNAVRIMTVHKSKGLEFPICILAASTKQFNRTDLASNALINKRLGFACTVIDNEKAIKYEPMSYKAVKLANSAAAVAEEMRVLYVAMTRAKERLIIPIVKSNLDKLFADAQTVCRSGNTDCGVINSLTYANWLLISCIGSKCIKQVYPEQYDGTVDEGGSFIARFISESGQDAEEEKQNRAKSDRRFISLLEDISRFVYPYESQSGIVGKFSVSELSKGESESVFDFDSLPDFMQQDNMTPAQRGTAVHAFMQHADFESAAKNVGAEITAVYEKGFLTDRQLAVINENKLKGFFESEIFRRIMNADKVYREYAFMTGIDSSLFGGSAKAGDTVVLQGIADCVIVEGDSACIIDYKTDYVKEASELIERYSMQLSLYRTAIEKLLELPVKQCLIYSFCLDTQIEVETQENVF